MWWKKDRLEIEKRPETPAVEEHEHNYEMIYTRTINKKTDAIYMCKVEGCGETREGESTKVRSIMKDYSMPQQPFD